MIIEGQAKEMVVIGEDTSKKARISQDKLAKLQYLLTKGLYKDPITAVIAEWTNNGIDSVVQAGKNPVENPVLVKIEKDNRGQYTLRVEDKGTGLDDRDFEDICMNYLESTKESDNDTIGHFGIGMKSFLSLERSATFTCIKNGVERRYLVYEGAEFVNFDLLYEKETDAENGVIAELIINSWGEKIQFADKARAKLAYYDTAVLIVDGSIQTNDIHRTKMFQWSTMNRNQNMHLCLKDVYYTIDWEALGIKQIEIPIALRLGLGDGVTPTPSRESYITNEKTKQLLLTRIGEVANWFVNRYNETVKSFKSFMEAYDYLGETTYYVKLKNNDKEFKINPLIPYSTFKVSDVKVEGISMRNPHDYKVRKADLLRSYSVAGYVSHNGAMKSKAGRIYVVKDTHVLIEKRVTVLVGDNFRGNIKTYLKEKYGRHVMFLKHNGFQRRLGKSKEYDENGNLVVDNETYRHVLELSMKPRNMWKSLIQEWNFVVSSIVSTFKDETKVEDSQGFLDWLDEKREMQKEQRRLRGNKVYDGLGKQVGDVTLGYCYERYKKIFFGKKAYPIKDLHLNKFLTVLITDDDNLELVKAIALSIKNKINLKFARVGRKEIKKVPDHFQFINFKKFMSRDCKPFLRLASCIKFQELLDGYEQVQNYKNPVFSNILRTFNKDAQALEQYVDNNMIGDLDENLQNIIIDVADQHDLYDKELWAEYIRLKEGVHKYDFINLLVTPSSSNHEQTKRYEKLVNQILLFRMKFYNDLPEGARIIFDPKPEVKTKADELV